MINSEKLVAELRKRFRSPSDCLRHLGIDTGVTPVENGKHDFRVALEQLLTECKNLSGSELEKIYELLDQHVPLGKGVTDRGRDEHEELDDRHHHEDHGTADRARARDQEEPEDLDDDDDDDSGEAEVREFLASKGMPDDAIATAIALRRKAIERGADANELPKNGTLGGVGGRASAHAMDSFCQMFPDADRIKGWTEPTVRDLADFNRTFPDARRIRQDTATANESASFDKMFPEAARIRVGA